MLLTCWKIAYVRGLQPALGAHTPVLLQPHGVTDSLQCSSFHASPGQASVQALRQPSISVRLRSRTGWLLPLSSLASGVGLAWYLDPGSSRGPTEVQDPQIRTNAAAGMHLPILSPKCERLKSQLETIAMRQTMLRTELQALQALNDRGKDSLQRKKELAQELSVLEQQQKLVLEEAKEEILKSP